MSAEAVALALALLYVVGGYVAFGYLEWSDANEAGHDEFWVAMVYIVVGIAVWPLLLAKGLSGRSRRG